MSGAFLCDAVRTPIGRYGGALAGVRADDLAMIPLHALMERNAKVDWAAVGEVLLGCANQAGEDNRNVARMAFLLAGLPESVPGTTMNRLCGSGMDAVGTAARAVMAGELEFAIAGGVESMSRAPFAMGRAESVFSRAAELQDTTMGWRFINPLMKAQYGVDSMPETAENVAEEYAIAREDQDAFALRSQQRAAKAAAAGFFSRQIEAFVSQSLACLRQLGFPDDASHVIPNGGAIALGHPLGMSGARLVLSAAQQLQEAGGRYALATMCIGVGQGIALALERV